MAEEAKIIEPSFQDRIYRELRQKIMLGDLTPGQSLTLRGV